MECQKCKKVLSKKGSHFVCQGPCQGTFHRSCVKGLAADMKAGIIRTCCNNCDEEESEIEDAYESVQDHGKILKEILAKVAVIPGLRKQLDCINQSMSVLSDKYDQLLSEQESSKQSINKLEKSVDNLNNKCIYLEKYNMALEQKVLELEEAGRKRNIEIVGIEKLPDENLVQLVNKIGTMIKTSCDEIEWIRRAPAYKQGKKPGSIFVGFKTTGAAARGAWLANRRYLVDINSSMITGGTCKEKVFINEDLAKSTRSLLWSTKKQLRNTYKYIWVTNGKVLVKKDEGEKATWVRSEKDLTELLKVK